MPKLSEFDFAPAMRNCEKTMRNVKSILPQGQGELCKVKEH